MPPTDRIASAFLQMGAGDAGLRTLGAYDRWIGLLQRADVRDELKALRHEKAASCALFREVRGLSDQLEAGLLSLLFESSASLAAVARDFAIF